MREDIFAAFNLTPWNQERVVVIGQDPYHGARQAHGLAFSVRRGQDVPAHSLQNIYQELMNDVKVPNFNTVQPPHGYLTQWSRQGVVLLMNTVLTVQAANANSHRNQGWEQVQAEMTLYVM